MLQLRRIPLVNDVKKLLAAFPLFTARDWAGQNAPPAERGAASHLSEGG
jgi:hypothetical protein